MNYSNELAKKLQTAGWFKGRKIDIKVFMIWYQNYGFHPPVSINNILEEFGDLEFRIPFFRELMSRTGEDDAYWKFHISPMHFIDDTYDQSDINDSIRYVQDMNHFTHLSLFPIAEAVDSDENHYDIFMAATGEIIGAYEGACGFLGHTFIEALNTLMTKDCGTFQDFQSQ